MAKKPQNWVSKFWPDFQKGLVLGKYHNHWRPLGESIVIKCTNFFPNFQRGKLTQKDKKSFQSLQQKYQNSAFFYPF